MRTVRIYILLLLCVVLTDPLHAQTGSAPTPEQVEFFEKRIRPILADNCWSCHGSKKQKAGLRLDSLAGVLKGTEDGPVVVKGDPDKSRLIKAIKHIGDVKMPDKDKKLPDQAIADLTAWVKMGLPWPDADKTVAQDDPNAWKKHWAFQPVRQPALPAVKDAKWGKTPVDAFVLATLEAKGLKPNPPADRRTLLRRVTFDLIGLPPTFEEITAFENDKSADAFARVVDRLLASPRYGERWGRHWLDVARYADTKGYVFLEERRYAFAYTYRDYVIRAFNEDLPYDRFVVEQLAADRLNVTDKRSLAAMGFLTLGRRFLNNSHDIIDDRIDVVSRGMLGLTVSCARCHDHKFDPVPTADYYSLYGVFASSVEPKDLPLIGEPERTPEYIAYEKELKSLEGAVKKYQEENAKELAAKNRKFRDGLRALEKKVDAFRASSKVAPPRAMVLQDAPSPTMPRILKRGNPNNPGPTVPRQFLGVLAGEKREPFTQGSGRLELARAIASKDNPLTARVLVNRVWLNHFGTGMVLSPSNFGLRSEPPSHPELLDYLATRFMAEGWSIKKLHRQILLSQAYQQSSGDQEAGRRVDPENRLLWNFPRQRLDFEALRDSLLFVSGKLDLKMGGAAVDITTTPFSGRRTIYGFIDRQNLPGLFRTFDFASPDTSSPQRFQTTVPQQALFLLNSPFVLEQARSLMQRAEVKASMNAGEKIGKLYQLLYGRNPTADETRLGERFLAADSQDAAWERYAQALLLANEFVFVD
jgi:Protein of unknown function (DUF1553)/Protein of unknown function (DUF1549)/Planctomycete cytochrome C